MLTEKGWNSLWKGQAVGRRKAVGIFLALLFLCSGCRLPYLFHAAQGQFDLIRASIPIDEALKMDSLTPEQKYRLRLVGQIKSYGEKTLGLKVTRNYETVYLKSNKRPIYMVSASPKDRLTRKTWWFPVVGEMPYLGFFGLKRAKEGCNRLMDEGLDVTMGVADAYSTLGWFRDPVTLNVIDGSLPGLAEVILHEMTHTTLYVKGAGEFNEGLALFVGKVGAFRFFQDHFGLSHPMTKKAEESIDDEIVFSSFLGSLLERLASLYDSPISHQEKLDQREKVFEEALEQFGRIKGEFKTERFADFGSTALNNAYLLSLGLYHRDFRLYGEVLRKKDNSMKEMMTFLCGLAREGGDILSRARDIASQKKQEPLAP